MKSVGCTVKQLPAHLRLEAARTAAEQNPANRPHRHPALGALPPQHIALLTSKYWGSGGVKLGVSFLDTDNQEFINLVLSHMNAWAPRANVTFSWSKSGGQVRIARTPGDGYWSYLGTDILHIPANRPTMNLDSFTRQTPVSEYKRVVRHETGHTLGFPHEHERAEVVALLDANKVIASFMASQGWSRQEVIDQILTPLAAGDIQATAADVRSIMCYEFDGSVTKSGQPIPGGLDINEQDYAFAAKIYPPAVVPPSPPPPVPPVSPPAPASLGQIVADLDAKRVNLPAGWAAQ